MVTKGFLLIRGHPRVCSEVLGVGRREAGVDPGEEGGSGRSCLR